jgi:hypothetical protein
LKSVMYTSSECVISSGTNISAEMSTNIALGIQALYFSEIQI